MFEYLTVYLGCARPLEVFFCGKTNGSDRLSTNDYATALNRLEFPESAYVARDREFTLPIFEPGASACQSGSRENPVALEVMPLLG